jgi:hypothetical protein
MSHMSDMSHMITQVTWVTWVTLPLCVHLRWVHPVLHMCDIRVLKGAAHVIDAVHC